LKKEQIHSVEMVGDATRIPIVQQRCKDVFGVEQVSRTLNSLECVARGASLQAAMLSPLFKVADYEVQEYNSLPVSITYNFASSEAEGKTVTKELFPVGSSFPSTKTITFDNKKGNMDLLVHYSEGAAVLPGLPREVAKYKIKEGKQKHNDKVAFVLRVSNNIHQIPCLESADLQEEWVEEEKIPVKKDIPAPPKEAPKTDAPKPEGEQAPDVEMKEEAKAEPPKP
jgi:heat shock protein 4